MRPSTDLLNNPAGLVDKRIAELYEALEAILAMSREIQEVSDYRQEIINVESILDEIVASGPIYATVALGLAAVKDGQQFRVLSVDPNIAFYVYERVDVSTSTLIANVPSVSFFVNLAPIDNPTFTGTVSGITKAMVGLTEVDNTADADKPISTATEAELNEKFPIIEVNAGNWDASSGSFPAGSTRGEYYKVTVAGTVDSQVFSVGDWLIPLVESASTSTFEANWTRGNYSQVVPSGLPKKYYPSFAAMVADTETYADGDIVKVAGLTANFVATSSTGTLGQANAGGQEFDVSAATLGVKDFGATGDGSTNDLATFTAAADLVGSGSGVDVPDATYSLESNETTSGRFWNIRGLLTGAGKLFGSTVAWVQKRGEPVSLSMVFGGFLSHVTYYSRQATAHLDSRATVAIQRRDVGSSANGPASAGYALVVNSEKEDYLTSAVEGEMDGMFVIARQGQKSDVGGILISVAKVGGDEGGVTSIEAASEWIDSSGVTTNRLQTVKGFLGQTSAFYGVTGTSGIGFWAEQQSGTSFSAFMADQVGSGAIFENLLYYTSGRDIANLIYRVDGAGRTYAPNASAALPPYSFVNDPDSGLARIAADTLGLVTGGAARVFVNDNGLVPGVADTTALGAYTSRFGALYTNMVFLGAASTNVVMASGSGTPEGTIAAAVGSLYTRTDGGANTTLYVKESGTGNTGWVAK